MPLGDTTPSSRFLRWAMKLQEYQFSVEYIKGKDNAADGYSQICYINATKREIN